MVLPTVTRSVSTFSGPRMISCRCSMVHCIRALHRLERRGWVISRWEAAPDRNREFKYYQLTDKGRKQLVVEESQWRQMAEAVGRVMWPAVEES
jgi:DNA-binding PadR family transcriptional regulator